MRNKAIKFLEAYQKEDIDVFFGRKKETELLYEKVRKSRLTLLYGLSGTGKTSLVRCGLANKFHETDWFELYVRRGDHILKTLRQAIDDHADTLMRRNTPLIKALNVLYLDFFKPVYLIFDQFEELFISGEPEEIRDFIVFLSELLQQEELHVRVILVLREEYFTNLDNFEPSIPIIFDSRLRLEPMSKKTLKEVIYKISKEEQIALDDPEKIIQRIIENISGKDGIVELPYLQVYLDKLANSEDLTISGDGEKTFDSSLIEATGKLEDILGDFLGEQMEVIISKINKRFKEIDKKEARELGWAILKRLITMDGTKKTVSFEDLSKSLDP